LTLDYREIAPGAAAGTHALRTKTPRLFTGVLFLVLASGCASNVKLDPPTIPAPLIEKMPMSVALRIPEEFEHFVHEDEVLGREQWSIDLGRSNAALFSQLFGFMFEEVTIIGPNDDATILDIDALIEPSIDAFEFSVPSQSKTDAYAVWIRYRLKVYDNAGTQHANWPLAAYGKSEQTGLTGGEPMKRAAVLAMRDAAALMIMKLDKATGLSELKDRKPTTVAGPPESETQTEEKPAERKLPQRREVKLPPPGPVAGPAVLSMDPDDADVARSGSGGNSDE
jgi:hypothetical protein